MSSHLYSILLHLTLVMLSSIEPRKLGWLLLFHVWLNFQELVLWCLNTLSLKELTSLIPPSVHTPEEKPISVSSESAAFQLAAGGDGFNPVSG